MNLRVIGSSKVNSAMQVAGGAVAKASLNRANKFDLIDPKPSDLTLVRVKFR